MTRENRLGILLADAMIELLRAYGDCAHTPPHDRDENCYSCQAMALCDRIWAELRSAKPDRDGDGPPDARDPLVS